MPPIQVIEGDLTKLAVDAIVNAANEWMLGGGGVDGAIHRAAGPELLTACEAVPEVRPNVRCPTGECRLTPGFRLPAKFVIHTVGPIWQGGDHGEAELLANCYRNSIGLAIGEGFHSLAFPAISCGVYGYPPEQAAEVAVGTIRATLAAAPHELQVTLVAFDRRLSEILSAAVAK